MIGRAAMGHPLVFHEAKHYLATGSHLRPVTAEQRFALMLRHTRLAVSSNRYGDELCAIRALRSMLNRLMTYTQGLPCSKHLRMKFCYVESVMKLEDIAAEYLSLAAARGAVSLSETRGGS